MNLKKLAFLPLIAVFLFSCQPAEKTEPAWQPEANGVWKYTIGPKNPINLLEAAKAAPKYEKINASAATEFPFDPSRITIKQDHGKLYIKFPLERDEQIYGLGLQFKSVNRKGKIYNLHVDHYGGRDDGRTHAPVPFYVSSKGYGVLINSARYITVYVGATVRQDSQNPPVVYDRNTDKEWSARPESDMVEILIPDTKAEIVVFNGTTPLETVKKYNLYTGGGPLPPKWGLGFTYRTHTLHTDEEVAAEVDSFEQRGFPLDFMGLEPGWMNRSYPCSYEWDDTRFPEPEAFVKGLLARGVRTNLWMNPYIAPKAELFDMMLPHSGSHTVWNGIVPDYTLPEPRQIFKDFYTLNHLNIGVSGLKIDEVDGYDHWLWPDVATFPSGLEAEQMRQVYGLLLQEMITDLYHQNNTRTWGLTRATNAGGVRFPFVLYNDYYKHEDFITALVNSGFSGLLWTPEARSSATGEEWLRRMQSVCFSPMAMINAWSSGTKPWTYPEVYEHVKNVALLRIQMLPYIYSAFADYHFNGTPPVRPMQLIEGFVVKDEMIRGKVDDVKDPYAEATRKDIKDQYMFGESILVAPLFTGESSRAVVLPKGKWYDFYEGHFVGENEIIRVQGSLDKIPLFVKEGGIIPMVPPRLHAPGKEEVLPLEVRHYGKTESTFHLYDDDGETFDYEKGNYSWTTLKASRSAEGQLTGEVIRNEGTIFGYKDIVWKFMTE